MGSGGYRRILALDQGNISGVAGTDDLCLTTRWSTVFRLDPKQVRAERFRAFGRWLKQRVETTAPDLLAYEAPVLGGNTSPTVLMFTVGLPVICEIVASQTNTPWIPVNNSQVKTHALGKAGSAGRKAIIAKAGAELRAEHLNEKQVKRLILKRAMVIAARARGWECRTDDEADVLWQLDFVCHLIREGKLK